MLPRPNRLLNRQDFSRVYSRGKQFRSPLVGLYLISQSGGGREQGRKPRFGISVSKKVGGAVQRNLVKRRIREACRIILRSLPSVEPAPDVVLVARQAALSADFTLLCETIEQLMNRALKEGASRNSRPADRARRRGGAPALSVPAVDDLAGQV